MNHPVSCTSNENMGNQSDDSRDMEDITDDIFEEISMSYAEANELSELMEKSFRDKLEHKISSVKLINTHVHNLPDRKQNGLFFGIDLGGSNLRVLGVSFTNGSVEKYIEYASVPNEILTGDADQLFDLIASVLEKCARKFRSDKVIDLKTIGFTFSFPVDQKSLTSGTLIHWTKGFDVKGVVGEDISKLVMNSIEKRPGITCENVALINDTVGTMLCGAQLHDNVRIGFIMGTGCNACYMEKNKYFASNSTATNGHVNGVSHEFVIVNTEFGGFGSNKEIHHLRNKYEAQVDAASIRPSEQIYEKMISGFYIVDTYKLIMKEVQSMGYNVKLDIDNVTGEKLSQLAEKADSMDIGCDGKIGDHIELLVARRLCERVALIAASGLSAILRHMGIPKVVIAADGSVIQKNHFIRKCICRYLNELVPSVESTVVLVSDGSGTGAAILASTIL